MSLTPAEMFDNRAHMGLSRGPFVRRGRWLVGLLFLQMVLLVASARMPQFRHLGEPTWHHNLSLAVSVASIAFWWALAKRQGRSLWMDRAHLGIWVLVWTILATVSGFLLLYLKQDLKAWELKDWAKWWHILWSWLALIYFMAHSAVNWKGMQRAWAKLHAKLGSAIMLDGGLLLIAIAIPVTWSAWGATVWIESTYIPWSLWTTLVIVGALYAAWIWVRVRKAQSASIPDWGRGTGSRIRTNVWLFVAAILANVSGFPLLYFGTKDTSLKYVAKYWHTWPSILFAALIFVHALQFWASMRVHWRKQQPSA